jgi:hypothetical protein
MLQLRELVNKKGNFGDDFVEHVSRREGVDMSVDTARTSACATSTNLRNLEKTLDTAGLAARATSTEWSLKV